MQQQLKETQKGGENRENRFPRPRPQTGGARQRPPMHPKLGLSLHPLGPPRPCRLPPRAFGHPSPRNYQTTLRLSGAGRRRGARRIRVLRRRLGFTGLRNLTLQALRDHRTASPTARARGASRRQRGGTSSQGRWYTSMVALAVPGGGARLQLKFACAHWPPGRPRLHL